MAKRKAKPAGPPDPKAQVQCLILAAIPRYSIGAVASFDRATADRLAATQGRTRAPGGRTTTGPLLKILDPVEAQEILHAQAATAQKVRDQAPIVVRALRQVTIARRAARIPLHEGETAGFPARELYDANGRPARGGPLDPNLVGGPAVEVVE